MPKKKTHLFTNKILGVSAGFHDAAAAVVSGGSILYAGHAERFSRVKNDPSLNRALMQAATAGDDPITIAYYENPYLKWLRMLFAGQKPKFVSAGTIAQTHFQFYRPNLKNYTHHLSHAAAGFQTSTFTTAIVVVVDAIGEWDTATIWHATYSPLGQATYKRLWGLKYPHSLGLFYSAMTKKVGLKPNEDEYILMGMAAYGKPLYKFSSEFFDGLKSKINWHAGADMVDEFDHLSPYDLAAEAQHTIEVKLGKVFALAENFAAQHQTRNLVYMGGVALNCSANSRVIDAQFWDDVWIMPNPGDAGSALGAAALAYGYQLEWDGPYLGTDIEGEYPVTELLNHLLTHKIAGVAAGPAEYGPRALGNRSLLADPRGSDIKDRVNEIKQRQKFRPFAPAILEEHAADYFDMTAVPGGRSPYMQFTVPCKDPARFPAIVHHDGTSRVQTVGKDCQSGLRQLLEQWYQATGCPMLLNTSLNIKGQPMVDTAEDARRFEEHYGVRVFVGKMIPRAPKQIAWVIASLTVPPINPEALREFGPIWSNWQAWGRISVDNIVCSDPAHATYLVERLAHTVCNLYVPFDSSADVRSIPGVKLIPRPANFHSATNVDLVLLLRQAAISADVVYLLGMPEEFDLGDRRTISAVVSATPAVNWVQLDSGTMFLSPDQFRNFSQSNLQCELESLKRR